jgi:hypothetical protein
MQTPPPRAPPRLVPAPTQALGDPPPGSSRVVIDSDGPASVEDVTTHVETRHGDAAEVRLVCAAMPCDAHLTQGPHVLRFVHSDGSWAGTASLSVGPAPSALRYALGHRTSEAGRNAGIVISMLGFGTSIAELAHPHADADHSIAIGGLVAGLLGIVIAAASTPEEQNGAATYWALPH